MSSDSAKPVTLGYWKIRGLAAPIRMMLEYCGVDYVNEYQERGPAPEYSREKWFSVKPNLGLGPFVNLPYYIDGDTKIVQSQAIFNHLSRKHGLDGKTEEERIRGDVMQYQIKDYHSMFTMMCYMSYEEKADGYRKSLPEYLRKICEYLGENKFMAGNEITKVDFCAYEYLSQMVLWEKNCLDDESLANLRLYKERIEAIDSIAKYLKSDRFFEHPVNNPVAKWT